MSTPSTSASSAAVVDPLVDAMPAIEASSKANTPKMARNIRPRPRFANILLPLQVQGGAALRPTLNWDPSG
jgi:hypothetical protein